VPEDGACAAAEIRCHAAVCGHGGTDLACQVKVSEDVLVEAVPVIGDIIKEDCCPGTLFLKQGLRVLLVCAGFGDVFDKGGDSRQKRLLFAVQGCLIENPEPVTLRGEQPRFSQNAQMPGDAGLAHFQDGNQFIHGQPVLEENPDQA